MSAAVRDGIAGLVLAGGQSRRMGGGHKSLLELEGQSLLDRALLRFQPQVGPLALSVNQDHDLFQGFGLPLLPDLEEGFAGPLAGLEAGLTWAQGLRSQGSALRYLALISCDAPFFPPDLVARLADALERAPSAAVAMAASQGRRHPVFSLWSLDLLPALQVALRSGTRKVEAFSEPQGVAVVTWDALGPRGRDGRDGDPFFNINRPEDLSEAHRQLLYEAKVQS